MRTLIHAVSRIPEASLEIAGDGPMREELVTECRSRGVDRVRFLGHLPPEEVRRVIARAKFIVIPSECHENCPMTILESMSHGKPVVGSHLGGIPELIEHGLDGFHFEAGNTGDLREKIERLLADPDLVRAMGQNAREKMEREYGKELHYRRLMEVYRSAVS